MSDGTKKMYLACLLTTKPRRIFTRELWRIANRHGEVDVMQCDSRTGRICTASDVDDCRSGGSSLLRKVSTTGRTLTLISSQISGPVFECQIFKLVK